MKKKLKQKKSSDMFTGMYRNVDSSEWKEIKQKKNSNSETGMCRNVFSGTIIKMKKSIVDVGQAEICVCYRKDSFWLTTSSKFDITNWRRRNAQLRSVNTLICCLTSSSKKKIIIRKKNKKIKIKEQIKNHLV